VRRRAAAAADGEGKDDSLCKAFSPAFATGVDGNFSLFCFGCG